MKERFKLPPIEITLAAAADGKVSVPETVQLLRVGQFYDKRYGDFPITSAMLLSIKKNFEDKILGVDPAIDYKHESDDIAAGWIRGLELREKNSQLWATVEWTPKGSHVLADKEFRYISADIAGNYENNESRKKYGPTLRGAGLTNRPVIKEMSPIIELTEGKGPDMDKDQQIAELQKEIEALKAKAAGGSGDAELASMKTQLEAANAKCAEYAQKIGDAEKNKALAEKKNTFDKMLSEGKAVEAQREPFMKDDMAKFAELAGDVKLGAVGSTTTEGGKTASGGTAKDVDDEIMELAEKKMADTKSDDLGKAISLVLSEKPELAAKRAKL